MDIDLNLLTVFDAVMTELSLTRAAKRLERTQSAVSHSLKRLRDITGDTLFERTGNGVRPTPRAVEMAEEVRRALSMIRAALEGRSEFDPAKEKRTFLIDIPVGLDWIVAPRLAAKLRNVPGVTVHIANARAGNLLNELRNRETWLALDYRAVHAAGYRSEMLIDSDLVLVSRLDHPSLPRGLTLEALKHLDQVGVGWSAVGNPVNHPIDERIEEAGLPRDVRLWVPTIASMIAVVEATDFVAYCLHRTAKRLCETHKIKIHGLPMRLRTIPLIMVWHEGFENDAGHRWLRDTVREICRAV